MPGNKSHPARAARSRAAPSVVTEAQPPAKAPSTKTRGGRGVQIPIVAIGASAGGLDACRKLLRAMPDGHGMAYILVQHLDPNHESMMADLLSGVTPLAVAQAAQDMAIEPDHLYVIPPGKYLSVKAGRLQLSVPQERHGARFPFDYLLRSLAADHPGRIACVVLSGTGNDGTLGIEAVAARGGLVLAQDPAEASYDGMPSSAIATGRVNRALVVADMPAVLARFAAGAAPSRPRGKVITSGRAPPEINEVIEMLRAHGGQDFRLYKPGTLQRRIERRMGMAAGGKGDIASYLKKLAADPGELDALARDLLIHVTGFFRDPGVFDYLAREIIAPMLRDLPAGHPVRVWVPGCSTGEEAYSLVMLFREAASAAKMELKLHVFASDTDAEAVAAARDGLYPETIVSDVSAARLARFFSRESGGWRVSPELRSAVVFTVQDVLGDPPFSRIDLISCRNLLIYLRPEAQAKVHALFDYALRDGGVLLLGSSETINGMEGKFQVISKPERLYRRIGRAQPRHVSRLLAPSAGPRGIAKPGPEAPPSRESILAELCRRLVLENYAPACVLINAGFDCLYSIGPVGTYLHVVEGAPTLNLLAMARQSLRPRLRATIQQAGRQRERAVLAAGLVGTKGPEGPFSIAVHPVESDGQMLFLVCFLKESAARAQRAEPAAEDQGRVAELERDLSSVSAELEGAIRDLEVSAEEQRVATEEARSTSEEFQSTNEELLTSKEELQSLNEELTALNTQLQETLEAQRTTSNDLRNILYSTDIATVFLDRALNIRFFTPATKTLFNVIPADIGRPLGDLTLAAADGDLLADAHAVLHGAPSVEREVQTRGGTWYARRVQPYRAQDASIEGVVVTLRDVTERRRAADALQAAKQLAEQANLAKSRFLATASHDLRQPLQTLALVHGLLAQTAQGERAHKLLTQFQDTVGAMSNMLNALLDINLLEGGAVRPEIATFPMGELLERLHDEFGYHAQARGLSMYVVQTGLRVRSDPRLLGQMLRNLLSNAVKYTRTGRILLGCRRHGTMLTIEVWDTGTGIPESEQKAIFDEYHQLDNATRERGRGLGLGLAIVQRLGQLLQHKVSVRSRPGRGSAFCVEVPIVPAPDVPAVREAGGARRAAGGVARRTGSILLIEDDDEMRDLLQLLLRDEGHAVVSAPDGVSALALVARGALEPDLILADFNLPNGMDGLQAADRVRAQLNRDIPLIVLTGDISAETLRQIARDGCERLYKPVNGTELSRAVQRNLPSMAPARPGAAEAATGGPAGAPSAGPTVFVIDDEPEIRTGVRGVLEAEGMIVRDYGDAESFLADYRPMPDSSLVVDAVMPGMGGIELLRHLRAGGSKLPAVMITGRGDVSMAVAAMKAGALDFIEKPFSPQELVAGVRLALEQASDSGQATARRREAASHVAGLTPRQRQIMRMVLTGEPSKNIAADLAISQRTVENHRAEIMRRTGTRSVPALVRLALAASDTAEPETDAAAAAAPGETPAD